MKKTIGSVVTVLFMLFSLSGCSAIGNKNANMAVIYGVTTVLSVIMLIVYCYCIKKNNPWYYLLYSSICVVNAGYLTLSLSQSVGEALLANRIAYLGSAFLPLAMLMIILMTCNFKISKYLTMPLLCITTCAFGIAATPGYSDIYYKSVSLKTVNGMTVLDKVYGPWHSVYLYYLLLCYALIIGAIIIGSRNKKLKTKIHASILAMAVTINILVWLMEQIVSIEFEFLSISYIVCGLFLFSLELLFQSQSWKNELLISNQSEKQEVTNTSETLNPNDNNNSEPDNVNTIKSLNDNFDEQRDFFIHQLETLTPTESTIYEHYLSGKNTKEIIEILNIKESTLKYHNRNLYSKLGVSSRKQLLEIAKKLKR